MTDEWFSEYVFEVKLVSTEVLDVMKQQAVVLLPWDPPHGVFGLSKPFINLVISL